ncbi:MAG: phosphate ABC transporter ATP-binding protein [Chloroflexales bacterium]|nr:phosphate ABC transporter ATP-binding protein [Chloroflexales bacterium]
MYLLENITKRYAERLVLDIPALEIRRGEVLALVGPSGAGKSTLLRLLNFLEPPTTGCIRYQSYTANGQGPAPLELRRQVTTVFQRPVLLNTTVLRNVAYGLQLRRITQSRQIAQAALDQVGLAHLADKPAHTLSSGEMQRVALARAMVIEPQVLLLDEPTANLDPYNVQLIEQTIRALHEQRGLTIVIVTHNIFQARRLAQQVALLIDGRIVEISDVKAFFEAPHDPRTAMFVRGEMVC